MSKILNIKNSDTQDEIRNKFLLNTKITHIKIDSHSPVTIGTEKSILHVHLEKKYGCVPADIFWIHYGTQEQMQEQIEHRYKAAMARDNGLHKVCFIESLGFMRNCDEMVCTISKKYPDLIFAVSKPIIDFRDRDFKFFKNELPMQLV
jgi:hypothetical protein